jgi:YebC/PmpR family DNA-binding regulatory protein
MSGHSKWSTIKRAKGASDAKRAKIFTKIGREIAVAARAGGANPDDNPALRMAVTKARGANMPKDTIKRAIEKATAASGGENWESVRYEAYGPGGVALLIDALTDNRNRTVAEVRSRLTKAGGNMGETGSVGWIFEQKGQIVVDVVQGVDADEVALSVIDIGAEDVQVEDGFIEIVTAPSDLETVRGALEEAGTTIGSAEVEMRPTNTVSLNENKGRVMLHLIEALEDLDDVQKVYSNADFPDSVLVEA